MLSIGKSVIKSILLDNFLLIKINKNKQNQEFNLFTSYSYQRKVRSIFKKIFRVKILSFIIVILCTKNILKAKTIQLNNNHSQ